MYLIILVIHVLTIAGVFVCIAPTSKLNRKQMSHLEKMFEIYATFMKETQELKIPEGVESGT